MMLNLLLYPFRIFLSGYFDDTQLTSFLTGAFTMGALWLVTVLQDCANVSLELDDDGDLSLVDAWNAPMTYISTQQRRMVSTMVDIQKHIGELPQQFERKYWPWETIRRKVLGEESDNDEDDVSATSNTMGDSIVSPMDGEEKEGDDFQSVQRRGDNSSDRYDRENKNNNNATKLNGSDNEGCAKKDEKQLCIGSIFGLDVGGTLAKLVYFEKKPLNNDPLEARSQREKHYVRAASAKTVLMARMHPNEPSPRGHLVAKRSTSMSPMRNFHSALISERNRARSSDELEFQESENLNVTRDLILPSIGGVSGCMPQRRTVAIDVTCPIQSKQRVFPLETKSLVLEWEKEQEPSGSQNKKSSEDLKNLYAIRQQSLPDDIRQFQDSVDFLGVSPSIEEAHESEEASEIDSEEGTKDILHVVDDDDENDSSSNPPDSSLSPSKSHPSFRKKRSLSMLDLATQHDRDKAEALNQFYDFARRLDTNEDSISDIQLSFYCRELGGEFHFISFETRKMKNAMDLIRFNNLHMNIRNMGATGGGAHKFADIWEQELAIGMTKQDELDSLVAGMQFVLSTVVGECFTFRPKQDPKENGADVISETKSLTKGSQLDNGTGTLEFDSEMSPPESSSHKKSKTKIYKLELWLRKVQRDTISYSSAYPYMLVTIGTGVSVLRVDGPRKHERVSGSTIGGGTFWGLMRLLTPVENFEDAMKLAEKGDPTKVDMMVGDIYGKDSDALEKLGLAADIVASSFGKLVSKEYPADGLTQEDLARALLSLVTNNIGQVAYLNAKLHKTPRIYFVGSFLRHNMISQRRLSYAIDYWSKGEMEALFLEHEGYFGALGAFLMTQNIVKKDDGFFQWTNNP